MVQFYCNTLKMISYAVLSLFENENVLGFGKRSLGLITWVDEI